MDKMLFSAVIVILLSSYSFTTNYSASTPDLDKAVDYLVANYNPTVGLIPEVPGGNLYWLISDNLLAQAVLKHYDPSNKTLTNIADSISKTLSYYMRSYGLSQISQYNTLLCLNPYFNNTISYEISKNNYIIKVHLNNGTNPLSPSDYADITFLWALHLYKQGDLQRAIELFNLGAGMYDGEGFNDLPFREGESRGVYQTYKLALYHLAGQILNQTVPRRVSEKIKELQAPNGGFYTGYYPNGTIPKTVTTNTETTCLIIYAYSPRIIEKHFNSSLASTQNQDGPSIKLISGIMLLIVIMVIIAYMMKMNRTMNLKYEHNMILDSQRAHLSSLCDGKMKAHRGAI